MALQSTELARREENGTVVRIEPLRVRWILENLVAADGHSLSCTFTCSVRVVEGATERKMLEEVFLAHSPVLNNNHVGVHFHSAFRTAAAAVCEAKPAADLLAVAGKNAVTEAIKAAGKKIAFVCGLDFLPPFDLQVHSPSLEKQRGEELQRVLAEQRAAGQLAHFQRAAELLRQFQEIRQSAPDLTPGDVLKQLNPADQGMMLQTLLMASGKEKATSAVWAVAGPLLVRMDPQKRPVETQLISLPVSLGPLRSVQMAQGGPDLLVGTRSGVIYVDPANPANARTYADAAVTSQMGFSRAVLWNQEIWACHSEAGVVAWQLDLPERPAFCLRPPQLGGAAPRHLQVLDESRLIFSTGDRLVVMTRPPEGDATTASARPLDDKLDAEVAAILPDVDRLVIVLANGLVQVRDKRTLEVLRSEPRRGPVTSSALLPWLGSTRLLLASEHGLVGVGLDDDLVTEYLSPFHGLRALAAAADLVVGLSADRQRIIYWHSWEPRQLAGEIFITALARHRAADVDL